MNFIKHISHSLDFATGPGARKLRQLQWIAVCALLAAGLAQFHLRRTQVEPAAALHGEAAVRQLKTDGGYASLAAAMAAARYQINAAPAKSTQSGAPFYANNPGQQLRATFASDEVRVSAASNKADGKTDSAELRLQLAGYGYGDQLEPLTNGELTAHGDRIEIKKSSILNPQSAIEEWYVNKPEGLEQGFTLAAPPAGGRPGEWLRVALSIGAPDSGWRVSLRGDQQGALFERQADGLRLSYDHLLASDALGRTLPARMELAGGRLSLLVDDAQAAYPLTIDPIITQQRKLTAADGAADDEFGTAVALSGNTAVIGAPLDDNGANGDQGSAYVFTRSGTAWTLQQKLTATDGAADDRFGFSVAISGDSVVVGAFGDDNGANADQGTAYVFTRSGTAQPVWTQQQKLTASDGAVDDEFGFSVALSGDTVVVGAAGDSFGANRSQGSAYVFIRSGAAWTQQQKLAADDGAANDLFGGSVAVSGDTVVVGAFRDAIGANAFQGSAYVFARSGTAQSVWTQQQKLTANDGAAGDEFGASVALSGDTVVVGAPRDNIGATVDQGSAYVFSRSGTTWTQQPKITASDGAAGDNFGASVAVSGDTVVVGAVGDAYGTNADQGSAYVFSRSGAIWTQQRKLTDDDGAAGDLFGISVAISGDTVLAGAPNGKGAVAGQGVAYVFVICANNHVQQQQLTAEDGAAGDVFGGSVALSGDTVVVGAFFDDIGAKVNQGSAYVFTRSGGVWTLQQQLTAGDGAAGDDFGISVTISGDTVVVGANGATAEQGAAYVFTRSGAVWTLQKKLTANDTPANRRLGNSVALSGDTLVVGAHRDSISASGQGSAYVFTRSGVTWTQQQKLTEAASDSGEDNEFGNSVAVSGDTAVVGAFGAKIGPNSAQGAAYVFIRSGGVWTLQKKLTASDGAVLDSFGSSVALGGDTVVVGAQGNTIGPNAAQGAAYVFTRSGAVWTFQQKLIANDGAAVDLFGFSVALSGDTVVVGAFLDDIGTKVNQGSAYVFTRSGATWTQQPKLTANDGAATDFFGAAVAISGDTIVVGAEGDDIGAKVDQGSAYVFVCPACPTITLNPASLPGGVIGASYSQTVTASGGAGPVQFSLSDGALPPGLSLAQNGLLLGAPITAGTFRFTITATILSSLCPGSRSYTLTVTAGTCPAVTINPPTLPAGAAGQPYSQTLTATGGAAPFNFTISAGALPNGMSLSAAGLLSGAPTAFGAFNFTVRATDANGCFGTRAYALTINPPCPAITVNPASLPNGAAGAAYQQTVTASGGASPHTFSVSTGSLPTGLNLSPSGVISGTPGQAGSFNFTVRATDANGCQGTRAYSLTINGGGGGTTGLQYYPLPHPIRLLDTRPGESGCNTPGAPISGGGALTLQARAACDGVVIPADAQAVVGNATVVNFISGGGFITLFPNGAPQPTVSNLNYQANQVIANAFTVGLGQDGGFKVFASSATHFIVDLAGYYAPPGAGGLFYHPLPNPIRVLDTRAGVSACTTPGVPLQGGAPLTQNARLSCNGATIPANAQAVVGNATAVNFRSGGGFITLWPTGATQPTVSNLNYLSNQIIPNAFTVALGAGGGFEIFASSTTDFIADITGYYSSDPRADANGAAGLLFNPLPQPIRLLDTRPGQPACDQPATPLQGGAARTQQARVSCDGATIPANAQAVVGNATVVNFLSGGGFITLWPNGAAQPTVSNLNYLSNQIIPNAFTVGLGASGEFNIFASSATHFIVDVTGYFAP